MPKKAYKLVGADGKTFLSPTEGTLGGHRGNKIYGALDCKNAARWIAKGFYVHQRVFFSDEKSAIAAGFRPCANCLPEKHKKWKAKQSSRR